jgi:hypothetical protein
MPTQAECAEERDSDWGPFVSRLIDGYERAMAALQELDELKTMKESLREQILAGDVICEKDDPLKRQWQEYFRRRVLAWEQARALVAQAEWKGGDIHA